MCASSDHRTSTECICRIEWRIAILPPLSKARKSPLYEKDEFGRPPMLLLRWVLKYVDIARQDRAECRADDLAQPIGPEGRQVFVLYGNGHPLASRLGSVRSVGQAGQIEKLAANRPSNAPSVGRAAHEQPPVQPRLRKGKEDIVP